jgi:hypothetical protein
MDLFTESIVNNLRYLLTEQKLKKFFPLNTPEEAVDIIIDRYIKYITYGKRINGNREEKYRKVLNDPITYLQKNDFLIVPNMDKESRDWYLYGDYPEIVKPFLKNLFIVDGVKIRDGAFDDESVLIRLIADGGTNRFKEIDYGK